MRADKVLEMAEFLDRLPEEQFDMTDWFTEGRLGCKTVACIAGWTVTHFECEYRGISEVSNAAGDVLNLTYQEQGALFEPDLPHRYLQYCTPKDAARVMRQVADGVRPEDAWMNVFCAWKGGYEVKDEYGQTYGPR